MLFGLGKSSCRRTAIRESRPDTTYVWWEKIKCDGTLTSFVIAIVFAILAIAILMMRDDVVPYRVGQSVPHDILARVDFSFRDNDLLNQKQSEASTNEPRVYRGTGDVLGDLQERMLSLPDVVNGNTLDQLPADLRGILDSGTLLTLQQYHNSKMQHADYVASVNTYIQQLRSANLVIITQRQRDEELQSNRVLNLDGQIRPAASTFAWPAEDALRAKLTPFINEFRVELQPKMLELTLQTLRPTHELDDAATVEAKNRAADRVPASEGDIQYARNQLIVHKGLIREHEWQLLRAENRAFITSLGASTWNARFGVAAFVLLMTIAMAAYIAQYQPRIVKNHARAIGIAALLLLMLLMAQLAGIGSGPIYLFAIAPTLLVAMILTMAYDQRFAIGMASMHGLLVTVGVDQRVGFLLIVWVGVMTACFMLQDLRTRSKLIEVGGVAAVAMMIATAAWGAISHDPWTYAANNALYAGAAGLSVGFVVLGILPFLEKIFRITTGMTLLELADASHPLLRRLSLEAPGTYNHSLQVATLAEGAAEAIGADSLLCRVASYYHDAGKIHKAEYFIENQQGGENRHINLTPSVSLLIIIGHVKDGIELAKEYNLPTSLFPFIQQHHGTTLVEFFYHAACSQQERRQQQQDDEPEISEAQYRYPGPKPRSKEVAILMLADAVESAARAMTEPTAARIESLVHDISMRRLLDGQFDDCDITMRELEQVERSLMKTLVGIYHGRIAYPSTSSITSGLADVKTA